ncbi:unnamed protein product [Kluyveromyces dobzhanskii CBS 2104]|uniref:sphingosine kinase n=1 Tax=Kluyveromyces dobzhanskii CBS 2104 TaxID=1427455 RepID=A0A0A8LDE4_9SACH|nr:unnamed protein product [Kluyveromyces dobzhanskii CBS 2104]
MSKLSGRYRLPYTRAIIGENGLLIKDQFTSGPSTNSSALMGGRTSGDAGEFESGDGDASSSFQSSVFETASLISCVTCLSDTESRDENEALLLPSNTVIPYAKILDVTNLDVDDNESPFPNHTALLEVTFAKPRRNHLVPKTIKLSVDTSVFPNMGTDVAEEILNRSYKNTKRNKSILVIINPHGGKGKANKLFLSKAKPLLQASGCKVLVKETTYHLHAVDIAKNLDIDEFDIIACASGDGIPHEVMNGLFLRSDRAKAFQKLAITQLPCGSGNAMSISCHGTSNPSYAALALLKSVESRIDVMCCTQPSYKNQPRLSFLSQTYGIIAESDINTEFIRFLGPARFELGVTMNVLQRKKYPCDIYVKYAAKSKNEVKDHYLQHKDRLNNIRDDLEANSTFTIDVPNLDEGSKLEDINITDDSFKLRWPFEDDVPSDWEKIDSELTHSTGIFYTGKMPYIAPDTKFFPAALPDDGTMDFVLTDARTPLTRIAPILMSLNRGSHVLQPEVEHSKIHAFRLVPYVKNSVISVDGESFPYETLQVEVLPKLVKTLLKNGSYVETDFESM